MVDQEGSHGAAARELQEVLLATEGLADFLQDVASRAVVDVPPALSCGVTVRREGEPLTMASSDAFANRLDDIQYSVDDGPCLHALRASETVVISDLDADDRWPVFRSQGLAEGLAATLSAPMIALGQAVGALNLYSKTPHSFDDGASTRAHRFAEQAAGAVALAVTLSHQTQLNAHLEAALASRTTIDQAIGVIMREQRCDAAQAFTILRAASNRRNLKLRDIAAELITKVSGKPPQPGPSVN